MWGLILALSVRKHVACGIMEVQDSDSLQQLLHRFEFRVLSFEFENNPMYTDQN